MVDRDGFEPVSVTDPVTVTNELVNSLPAHRLARIRCVVLPEVSAKAVHHLRDSEKWRLGLGPLASRGQAQQDQERQR